MRSVTVIVLIAFARQAFSKETLNQIVGKLVDKLSYQRMNYTNLDHATLLKPGQLATSVRASGASSTSHFSGVHPVPHIPLGSRLVPDIISHRLPERNTLGSQVLVAKGASDSTTAVEDKLADSRSVSKTVAKSLSGTSTTAVEDKVADSPIAVAKLSSAEAGTKAKSLQGGQVSEVHSEEEFDEYLQQCFDGLVVLAVSTTWCGPCKMFDPKFKSMASEYSNVRFFKVEADENESTTRLMKRLNTKLVPAFYFFHLGEIVADMRGPHEDKFRFLVERHKPDQEEQIETVNVPVSS